MKVVIKRPNEGMQVIEVSGLSEINKLVGNVDENGEGESSTGSDYRQGVFKGIDIHMNGNAIFSTKLPSNFWDTNGNYMYCGNVIFAGYNPESKLPYGVCSLTDEQIEYLKANISQQYDIFF